MGEQKIESGAYVFNEGDSAEAVYTVVSGKIELLESSGGKEAQIGVILPGKVFGELAVFAPQSLRPHAARAMEPSVLSTMTGAEFQSQLLECPKAIQPILQIAIDKMKATKSKAKTIRAESVLESDITKLTIAPASDVLKAIMKPIEVPILRLPFRIGGYPEGGEISRRDQLHLSIPSQENPLRVSRQHCEVGIENKAIVITDLGSRFCTWVNGTIIGRGRGTYVAPLTKGANEIILGASDGPYKLTITCS